MGAGGSKAQEHGASSAKAPPATEGDASIKSASQQQKQAPSLKAYKETHPNAAAARAKEDPSKALRPQDDQVREMSVGQLIATADEHTVTREFSEYVAPETPKLKHPARDAVQSFAEPSPPRQQQQQSQQVRSREDASSSGAPAQPLPDPEDPWAALQSAYRVTQGPAARQQQQQRVKRVEDDDDDEVVMLFHEVSGLGGGGGYDEDDEPRTSLTSKPMGRARGGGMASAPAAVGPSRAGGWGDGDLAKKGTLMMGGMMGEEQPAARASAGFRSSPGQPPQLRQQQQAVVHAPIAEDLGVLEDIEDFDSLIASEMEKTGLNADLAKKLAQFEALNDFDD